MGQYVVFECSGNPLALHLGLRLIRKKGKYVQAGILREPVKMNLEQILFAKEITLLGSHTQKPSSWKRALNLLSEGKINLKALVTDELPLTCWKEGFKKAKEEIRLRCFFLLLNKGLSQNNVNQIVNIILRQPHKLLTNLFFFKL